MGLIFPGLKSYCNGCDINMKLRPLLPPLLTVGGTGNGDPSLIPVEVQMGELMWEGKDPDRILRMADELPGGGERNDREDSW